MKIARGAPRRGSVVLVSVLAMAAPVVVAPPAGLADPARPSAAAPSSPAPALRLDGVGPGPHRITLVTGDRLVLTGTGGGQYTVSLDARAARPAGVPEPTFQVQVLPTGAYVVPSDVLGLVAAGRVDRGLFDVKYLVENGYADAATDRMPVIVRYPASQRAMAASAEALPASSPTVTLNSIHSVALAVTKTTSAEFWAAVRGAPSLSSSRSKAVSTLAGGIERISLDGKAKILLDQSTALIGAPQAWQAGLDGTGVTVAVLDTGVDLNHPDLAGKVIESRSFVEGLPVQDGNGHGTHVASTIAGSGAASGGRLRGVAPGARLLIGKVCNDRGECPDSAITAGMEWAAASGADVVSMSLGSGPTDGTDEHSETVNALTASSGALFVIAAGNSGPGANTVSAPSVADAALSVAATTKSDGMANFSSRGPRIDGALKPDIAAPGVDIVAARAAGTSMGRPVDESYTSANGTSMATPHVSGAVAIMVQQHPEWTPGQLKAALMSTSHDAGFSAFDQGTGRVDVARAVGARVFATTVNVDFGAVDPGQDPADKQVTYSNLTDAPVTLDLTASLRDGDGNPVDGRVRVDRTVTVPAGGTASVPVVLDVDGLGLGRYTGAITAVDEESGVRLRTAVGAVREAPRTNLTIRTIGPDGQPIGNMDLGMWLTAVDVPGVTEVYPDQTELGVYRARVRPGTYSVHVQMYWVDFDSGRFETIVAIDPEIDARSDVEITLDGRQAELTTVSTPRPTTSYGESLTYHRSLADGSVYQLYSIGHYLYGQYQVRVIPTERASTGIFRFARRWVLSNPQVTMSVLGRDGFDLTLLHRAYADRGQAFGLPIDGWVPFSRSGKLELVDAGYGDPEDLAGKDLRGKLALLRWGDDRFGDEWFATPPNGEPEPVIFTDRVANLRNAGAAGYIAAYSPTVAGWERAMGVPHSFIIVPPGGEPVDLPEVQVPRDQGGRLLDLLKKGKVTIDTRVDQNVRYSYYLHPFEEQQIGQSQDFRFDQGNLAEVDTTYHAAQPYHATKLQSPFLAGQTFAGEPYLEFMAPRNHTEFVGPVSQKVAVWGNVWQGEAQGWQGIRRFDRPGRTSQHWGTVPTTPGVFNIDAVHAAHPPEQVANWMICPMCREGDVFWPTFFDTQGDGGTFAGSEMIDATARLFRGDGQEIPLAPVPRAGGVPGFTMPKEADTYRLVQNGPGVSTTWTFASAAPTSSTVKPGSPCMGRQLAGWTEHCQPAPLVFVGYDLSERLDLNNRVTAPGRHTFRVHAYHSRSTAPMPKVTELRMWTSTNDGGSWTPAEVRRLQDGSYQVSTTYPRVEQTKGAVSLKVIAKDAAGNQVEQVNLRAFELRDRKSDS